MMLRTLCLGLSAAAALAPAVPAMAQRISVEPVEFLSRDGKTQVKAYVFKPADGAEKAPAVVMMHGRSAIPKGSRRAHTRTGRRRSTR